jgi:hypothetical protein
MKVNAMQTGKRKTIRSMTIPFVMLMACTSWMNAAQAAPNGKEAVKTSSEAARTQEKGHLMNIHITIGTTTLPAMLDDNPTARDFADLLPLTVTLEDFQSAEKKTDALPKRLSQKNAQDATSTAVGDIMFYAPWGNLALFYRAGSGARGLIKMGRITSGVEILRQPGPLRATISRAD